MIKLFCSFLLFSSVAFGQATEMSDSEIVKKLKSSGIKLESERAIVWVEDGQLSNEGAQRFLNAVTKGIIDIEHLLLVSFDTIHYNAHKIEYFVSSYTSVSHVYNGYRHNVGEALPYVFISSNRVRAKSAPYLHETTHLILWDFGSLWLREGLAEYCGYSVAKQFGGYYINMFSDEANSKEIHSVVKSIVDQNPEIKNLIGKDGVPDFRSIEQRSQFYLVNFSFVSYLVEQIGLQELLPIYKSQNTSAVLASASKLSIDNLKAQWLDYLKTKNQSISAE